MLSRIRDVIVIAALAVCLGGPVAAVVLPLLPAAWRRPPVAWGILLAAGAVVGWLRRRRGVSP
jgi:hypothetical protein